MRLECDRILIDKLSFCYENMSQVKLQSRYETINFSSSNVTSLLTEICKGKDKRNGKEFVKETRKVLQKLTPKMRFLLSVPTNICIQFPNNDTATVLIKDYDKKCKREDKDKDKKKKILLEKSYVFQKLMKEKIRKINGPWRQKERHKEMQRNVRNGKRKREGKDVTNES